MPPVATSSHSSPAAPVSSGANLAHRLLEGGERVLVLDSLARAGVEENLRWLRETHGERLEVMIADVRDAAAVRDAVDRSRRIFHFAAQVAVTTSLIDPREDFAVNAQGTLNVLEAARAQRTPPSVVFTSTNKVYGSLDDVELACDGRRYDPVDPTICARGIGESRSLDFHSPYGCSKGTADQYVVDYARSFGLPTVVFRMSCIYGPHQFGTEDQGWVAHFLIRALEGKPITLYGDGKQVRDILFVEDLVDAFLLASRNAGRLAGRAFNIGGGARNAISLLELLGLIEAMHGERPAWTSRRGARATSATTSPTPSASSRPPGGARACMRPTAWSGCTTGSASSAASAATLRRPVAAATARTAGAEPVAVAPDVP